MSPTVQHLGWLWNADASGYFLLRPLSVCQCVGLVQPQIQKIRPRGVAEAQAQATILSILSGEPFRTLPVPA